MRRAGLVLQDAAHVADLGARIESSARRVTDNYNNLTEAPTIFYAAAIVTVLLGTANGFYAGCAVAYLLLRIVYSLVQATFNSVRVRATLYGCSWGALLPLIFGPLCTTLLSHGGAR